MKRSRITALLAVSAAALAGAVGLVPLLGAGTASAATAATPAISSTARTQAETAISIRITDLNSALTLVQQTGWFVGSDQAALENIITGDLNGNGQAEGLVNLATTIRNETNPANFWSEFQSIYKDYRVFALALPQVHLVRVADRMTTNVVPDLTSIDTDLSQAIAKEAVEGKNVQAAQQQVANLETQIATIGQKTTGVSTGLLALTPAQWNANHGAVAPYWGDVQAADSAAIQGEKDVRAALEDLQ